MRRRWWIWVGAALASGSLLAPMLLLAPAALAAPPVLTVTGDRPTAVPTGHNWMFDDFFPRSLSVAKGSTVNFQSLGFHTTTLLPHSVTVAGDLRSNGVAGPDSDDTTPNPNGTPHALLRGTGPVPGGCGTSSKPCTFDGSKIVSSGAFFGPTGPFAVKVTAAPGTYAFHCRIHPTMVGAVVVLPAGRQGTTQAQLSARVAAQVKNDVAVGLATEQSFSHVTGTKNKNGTTTWRMWAGADTPGGHVAILEFLPRNLPVKAGDSVRWVVTGRSEPHTVTFPGELHTDLIPLCESGTTDKPATPLHNPPKDPTDFTCGGGKPPDEIELGGGNGKHAVTSTTAQVDSGFLITPRLGAPFGAPASALIASYAMTFTGSAGTYHYVCQIHDHMNATITVHP